MKFRLVYEGDIFSAQRKSKENQHKIRENFHYQIKNLLESDRVHDSVKNAHTSKSCSLQFYSDGMEVDGCCRLLVGYFIPEA